MTGFDVRKKRPWWLGWIPATVLVVLVAAAGITSAVVVNSGLGKPLPKPTVGQVTDLNWSSFTDEGVDYIDRSRDIRIDLSRPPVRAADVGLPDDGSTTIGPTDYDDRDNDYYVILNGGGEGHGGTKLTATSVTITTQAGLITGVHTEYDSVRFDTTVPFRNALAQVDGESDEYGWGELDTAAIFTEWVDTTGAGDPYSITIGPGDRLGFGISATISCPPNANCTVDYDVTPRVG